MTRRNWLAAALGWLGAVLKGKSMVDYPRPLTLGGSPDEFMYFGPGMPYTKSGPGLWYNAAGDRVLFGAAGNYPADTIIRAYRSTASSQGEEWAEVDSANHPTDCQEFEEVFIVRHPTDSVIVCVIYNRAASGQPDIVVREFNLETLAWGISYGGTSFPDRRSYRVLMGAIARPANGDVVMLFGYYDAPDDHIAFVSITPGPGASWGAEIEAFPGQPSNSFPGIIRDTFFNNYLSGPACNDWGRLALTSSGKVYALFGLTDYATEDTDFYQSVLDTDDSVTASKICDGMSGDFSGWTGILTEMSCGSSLVSSGDKVFLFLGAIHYDNDTSTYSWSTYAGYCADGGVLSLNLGEITEKPHAGGKGLIYPQAYYVDGKVWLFGWDDCNDPADHNFYCTYSTATPPARSEFLGTNDLFPSTPPGWISLSPEHFVLLPGGRLACTMTGFYWETPYSVAVASRGWAVIGRGPAAVKLNASGGYARCG